MSKGYGHNEAFTRGFDRGNYGGAYESQDWESWYATQLVQRNPLSDDECEGMLLGFFSSYELDEIGDEGIAEEVAALRAKWGDE